jgi:hypothetical protein
VRWCFREAWDRWLSHAKSIIGVSRMSTLSSGNYGELLVEIKQRIRSAQYEALRAVNKELIALYFLRGASSEVVGRSGVIAKPEIKPRTTRCNGALVGGAPSLHHFGEPFSLGSAFIGTIRARSPTSFGIEPNKHSLPRATECDRSACITRTHKSNCRFESESTRTPEGV